MEYKALAKATILNEFWGNDKPKCPHCGVSLDVAANDMWGICEEGEHETWCPECDQLFTVHTDVTFSYSTDEQDDRHEM